MWCYSDKLYKQDLCSTSLSNRPLQIPEQIRWDHVMLLAICVTLLNDYLQPYNNTHNSRSCIINRVQFIATLSLLWEPTVMGIASTLIQKKRRTVSGVFSFAFTQLGFIMFALCVLSSFFDDHSLLPVTWLQFLHFIDIFSWDRA